MTTTDIDRSVDPQHRMCRVFMHAWDYTTVKREGRIYLQGLACMRCGTERFMKIDPRTGEIKGASYRYAAGYLFNGGGALSSRERAELRLAEVTGHMPSGRRRK